MDTGVGPMIRRFRPTSKRKCGLKSQIELNKMVQDWDQIAYLTPGSRGYSPVRTDLGAITISLDDVQPYGNGTKIKLRFGNTTDAILDGVKAKVEYGTVDRKS